MYISVSFVSLFIGFLYKIYYLIEYDINIDKPRVSDYHIFRFRWKNNNFKIIRSF